MRHLLLMTHDLQTFMSLNAHCNQQNIFVHNTTSLTEALATLAEHTIVAIVWDLRVTDLDQNLQAITDIRRQFNGPIMTLTTEKNLDEELKLFDLGIDDYLYEPLEFPAMMAMLNRRLTVATQQASVTTPTMSQPVTDTAPVATIKFADLVIDHNHYQVYRGTEDLGLTPKEFKLLTYLLAHKNQVLSREQLLHGVWGYDILGTSRIVDMHISHLRDKIEQDPQNPLWIKTVRGFGYVLKN